MGIAGTCLGFYFSSGNPDKTPGSDPPAKIVTPAPASAINALAATRSNEGKTITVSGTIAEAGPGWDVVVSYKDGVFPPSGVKTGEAGEFTAVSTAPAAAPGATKATITATGPDNKTAGGSLEIP